MKIKAFLVAALAMLATLACSARDQYSTDVNVLPVAARTLIATHFPKQQVNHIKIDKHTFGGADYDVILSNGTEIDFDSKGNLEEVDCSRNGKVPDALVGKAILDYVNRTYPKQNIVKYDVKRNGYEVELQSGIDLVFNKQGVFQRVDD